MEQWRIEQPQSLDLTGVRRLNIRMVAGSVDVVGRPDGAGEPGEPGEPGDTSNPD